MEKPLEAWDSMYFSSPSLGKLLGTQAAHQGLGLMEVP